MCACVLSCTSTGLDHTTGSDRSYPSRATHSVPATIIDAGGFHGALGTTRPRR